MYMTLCNSSQLSRNEFGIGLKEFCVKGICVGIIDLTSTRSISQASMSWRKKLAVFHGLNFSLIAQNFVEKNPLAAQMQYAMSTILGKFLKCF